MIRRGTKIDCKRTKTDAQNGSTDEKCFESKNSKKTHEVIKLFDVWKNLKYFHFQHKNEVT